MSDIDYRFMDAVDEMSAEVRERFPAVADIEWPDSHTDAFASGVSFVLRLLSASERLFEVDEDLVPTLISPEGTPLDQAPDPGFDRLCEIFVEVWERHRRDRLDEFLSRLRP